MHRKKKSIATKFKKYIIIIASIMLMYFIIIVSITEYNKFSNARSFIKENIYTQRQIYIKTQVELSANAINSIKESANKELKLKLVKKVDEGCALAVLNYNKYKNKFTEKQIKDIISKSLAEQSFFEGRGYFYIIDMNADNIVNTTCDNPHYSFSTKSFVSYEQNFRNSLVDLYSNKNENFIEYNWKKYDDSKNGYIYRKISFTKKLPFYNWILGAGDYYCIVDDDYKKKALNILTNINFENDTKLLVNDFNGKSLINGENISDSIHLKKIIKTEGGFLDYYLNENGDNGDNGNKYDVNHLAYVQIIKDWDWIIAGFTHIDTSNIVIDKNITSLRKEFILYICYTLGLICILIIIILFFAKRLKHYCNYIFYKYMHELSNSLKKNTLMDEDKYDIKECRYLSKIINEYIKTKNVQTVNNIESIKEKIQTEEAKDLN